VSFDVERRKPSKSQEVRNPTVGLRGHLQADRGAYRLVDAQCRRFSLRVEVVTPDDGLGAFWPGKVYAANYAVPSPSRLTTAVSNMGSAYTDAAQTQVALRQATITQPAP
jgi:hypothetical protein